MGDPVCGRLGLKPLLRLRQRRTRPVGRRSLQLRSVRPRCRRSYYGYPGPAAAAPVSGRSSIGFTEFYAKPSYKVTSWLTVGGIVAFSDNGFNSGESETYYAGNAAVVLPWTLPMGITSTISGEIGRQTYGGALKSVALFADYTTWNIGIAFNYKAVTLDLRYVDTDASPPGAAQCTSTPSLGAGSNICKETYVATLKFDTTFSSLK